MSMASRELMRSMSASQDDLVSDKTLEFYTPYEDNDFSEEQRLLIRVVEFAVEDCKRAFTTMDGQKLSQKQIVHTASGARFLLSKEGRNMMWMCEFGRSGLKAAEKLAINALSLIGLTRQDVFKDPATAWYSAVATGKWPAKLRKSRIKAGTGQRTFPQFRPFLLAA